MKGAARNKLLVKGASSYNALKRAIKQDLVDAGGAPQDPNLLYEVRPPLHIFVLALASYDLDK